MLTSKRLLTLLVFSCLAPSAVLAGGFALVTLEEGESLSHVAERYGMSSDALMEANQLDDPLVHPGDRLRVPLTEATGGTEEAAPEPPPGFRRHVLRSSETLSDVVTRFDLDMEALVGANPDLSSLDRLPAGMELLIPPEPGLLATLEPGDDLVSLVRRHGADPVQVLRANGIESPGEVEAGMLVFLPGIAPEAAMERLAEVRERETRYLWPAHGRITSYYGRRNLGMGTSSFHRGIDLAAPSGTAVHAARSGTVSFAGWSEAGYGYLVRIRHMGNEESYYAHLSEIDVSVGEYLEQGEPLGRIGNTGLSTGPHLHFEIRRQGSAQDPLTALD